MKNTILFPALLLKENFNTKLGRGALDGSVVDAVDDVMRIHAVHGAAHGLRGAENLLHAAAELLAHGARPHHAGSLLPVPGRLLQRLDDEGGGGGNHGAGGLSVLHLQLHGHLQTLPVAGGLSNVVSDLLGGETEGTNLGCKGRGCADLASDRSQVDVLDLIGIELGTHFSGLEEGGGD